MIELIDNIDDNIIESIFLISSKSEYITLSKNYIKNYIEDKNHKVVIIKDDEKIVGFIIYFLLSPEIDILFIATSPNNKGYGNKLLSYLFDDAKNNNVDSIKLDLHENNINAKEFYTKNGFQSIGVRKKYYNNKYSALILEKKL
ncbi:GNAT family N-acetyltransferase [Brachyspira pilosicoli]|uniref:GNAT family N-acetyltransferase n=1 Tax=Brachyspira pilosicoli TaxID=52584 RepID=UPI0024330779|nr:GNAT family N-acetyltransferase [Brachyspira pilosicoli]